MRQWIAFTSSRSGNGDIWAIEPTSGELRRLSSHETPDFAPRYSAHYGRLFFASERVDPTSIYVLPGYDAEIGERPRRLFENPSGEEVPDFSSDGRELVYVSDRGGNSEIFLAEILAPDAFDADPRGFHFGVDFDVDFGRAERLTRHVSTEKQARISPDGRSIVYVSDLEGQQDLFVLDRDSGVPRNITQHPALEGHPEWAPDSKSLLFYRMENGDADLYEIAADGTGAAVNLTRSEGHDLVGRFSPDGDYIAFGSARSGDWEIYLMRRDGSDVQRLTDHEGFDGDPVFFPAP